MGVAYSPACSGVLGGVKGDKQNLHKLIILTPVIVKFKIIFIYTAPDVINIVLRHLRDIQGLTPNLQQWQSDQALLTGANLEQHKIWRDGGPSC